MPITIIHPEQPLSPADLDDYLTAGWRPAGQSVYCADYLRTDDDAVYGCLQLRLPLKNFTFKKRHAKTMRRLAKKYRVRVTPAGFPDREMWEVNRRYMLVHPEKSRADIEYHLVGDMDRKVLNTHVVKIYDGDRLAGFSFFDVGEQCCYTKAGIYDPEYVRDGLGTYSILLEIDWCLRHGKNYYHPGYYSPGYPAFDYKMSFGPTEYREVASGKWIPLPADRQDFPESPLNVNRRALERVRDLLPAGFLADVLEYPSFTACFHYPGNRVQLVDSPYVLVLNGKLSGMITYENSQQEFHYFLQLPSGLRDTKVLRVGRTGIRRFTSPVRKGPILARGNSAEELVSALRLEPQS